jgi:ArsR family transcriptional regulator
MKYGPRRIKPMKDPAPTCQTTDHTRGNRPTPPESLDRAAQLFRALGDGPRLRILEMLTEGELCVTEIVAALNEKFSTVSQRLRILRSEGLVIRRRAGTHLFYALADRHVADLIHNAVVHANEQEASPAANSPEGE